MASASVSGDGGGFGGGGDGCAFECCGGEVGRLRPSLGGCEAVGACAFALRAVGCGCGPPPFKTVEYGPHGMTSRASGGFMSSIISSSISSRRGRVRKGAQQQRAASVAAVCAPRKWGTIASDGMHVGEVAAMAGLAPAGLRAVLLPLGVGWGVRRVRWAIGSARSSQIRRASEGHDVPRRLPPEGPRAGWEAWGAGGRIFGLVCVVGGRISVWRVCAVARTLMGSQRRAGVAVWAVTPPACSDLKKRVFFWANGSKF